GVLMLWSRLRFALMNERTAAWSTLFVAAGLVPLALSRGWSLPGQLLAGLKLTGGFALFLSLGRSVVLGYLERSRRIAIEAENVEEGVLLTPETRGRFVVKAVAPHHYPDGLSKGEAEALKKRLARRSSQVSLVAYRARAFAVWLFAGFLWTVLI